jgi:hypothetical protein
MNSSQNYFLVLNIVVRLLFDIVGVDIKVGIVGVGIVGGGIVAPSRPFYVVFYTRQSGEVCIQLSTWVLKDTW